MNVIQLNQLKSMMRYVNNDGPVAEKTVLDLIEATRNSMDYHSKASNDWLGVVTGGQWNSF